MVTFQDAVVGPQDRRGRVRVGDISGREIVTTEPKAPALDAIRRMFDRKIGRPLVTEGGLRVGFLTRTDLMKAVPTSQAQRGL